MKLTRIEIILEQGRTYPNYSVNMKQIQSLDNNDVAIHIYEDTVDKVELVWPDKPSSETVLENGSIVRDQTIEVSEVWVENILLDKRLLEETGYYTPYYRDDFIKYCEENNIALDLNPQRLKFWHAGKWSLEIASDFWDSYSQKFRQKEVLIPYLRWDHEVEQQIAKLKECINAAQ